MARGGQLASERAEAATGDDAPTSGHGTALVTTIAALGVLLLAMLPALAPLLEPGLPVTDDGHLHLYRLVAQDHVIRATGAPSRWLPDLAYDYGAPIFSYYAPLAYVPALAASLLGWGYVAGLKLAFGLPLVASALTMFVLVKSLFGTAAGLAAGLVYAYLPYQLIDLYVRGALAETAAFAWLPLICWCLVRLRTTPDSRWTAATALAIGGLVLTHNIVSLFALPALLALAGILWWPAGNAADDARPSALRVGVAFALGIGLGAWYWLPAIVEKGLVQTEQALIAPERFLDYFLHSWPPIQVSLAYDYAGLGTEEWGETKLGIVQVAVLVAGALATTRTRGVARRVAAWAVGMALAATVVQARFAAPLFELVPLAGYIQFPWRLLTLVGLATAILTGALVRSFPARFGARPLAALLVVGLSAYAGVARLAPGQTLVDDGYLAAEGALASELADAGVATTWFGELIPATVPVAGQGALRRAVLYGDGLAPASPDPADLDVEVRTWTPTTIRARVVADRPDQLLVHQFFYPGWVATVDGRPTPVRAGGRLGVLAIDVPAGAHDVELSFGWTGPRLVGLAVSAVALGGLILLVGLPMRRVRRAGTARRVVDMGAAVLAFAVLAGLPGSAGRQVGAVEAKVETARVQAVDVDGRLSLAGSSLDASLLAARGSLGVTLYWLSRAAQTTAFDVRLRIVRADGVAHDAWWLHGPTRRAWDRGELARTRTDLRLPADFPAGPARVLLVVEQRDAGASRPPEELDLGGVDVPSRRADSAGSRFERTTDEEPLDVLRLVSYDARATHPLRGIPGLSSLLPRSPESKEPLTRALRPGDALDVLLDWEVRRLPYRDVVATVELRARRASTPSGPRAVGDWFHPFVGWQVGDRIGQQLRLSVPDDQAPGAYDLVLRLATRERPWVRLRLPGGRADRDADQGSVILGSVLVEGR